MRDIPMSAQAWICGAKAKCALALALEGVGKPPGMNHVSSGQDPAGMMGWLLRIPCPSDISP